MLTKTAFKALLLSLTPILLALTASPADASYFRFWRGTKLPAPSPTQFQAGLNQALLPETGKLAQTSARLRTYQPVVLSPALIQAGFPWEVALLEYESEATYQAYRSSPAGKAYGDLHWQLFEKERSGSVVPEAYRGSIQFDHAYDAVGADTRWNSGHANFRVYLRAPGFTDERFQASVRDHIEYLLDHRVTGLMVLVTRDYVMEYSLWPSPAHQRRSDEETAVRRGGRAGRDVIQDDLVEATARVVMDTPLRLGNHVQYGTGVRYRVR